ncbi:MAG: hypothetical protein ACK479_04095 [Fluviicola sp.]
MKNRLISFFKKPLLWLGVILVFLFYTIHFRNQVNLRSFITSDAEGYFAYLPAFFLHDDPSYAKTMAAKQSYHQEKLTFWYPIKTKNGKTINKCFPGVAVMQAPSFLATTAFLKVIGKPTTGYSNAYLIAALLTAFLFLLIGVHYLTKSLQVNYSKKEAWIAFLAIFFGTNLFFSTLNYPIFSHIHTFFLYALLLYQFLLLKNKLESKRLIYIGILLGLIALVRPTNLIIVAFLLFFFDSWKEFVAFLRFIFLTKKLHFLKLFLPFFSVLSIWFLMNFWQTGHFVYWSYQGEGFNFTHPRIWESWFSYHIGIFVHHPVLLVAILGLYFLFKENKFKFFVWLIYFFGLSWLVSSWWCWDYESSFGHRGFSEHFIIFIYPLLALIKQTTFKKTISAALIICVSYTGMRFYQRVTQIFNHQRFTPETYWKSFFDFDNSVTDKYVNLVHPLPFGHVKTSTTLASYPKEFKFDENTEFGLNGTFNFPKNTKENRFFVTVEFEKKMTGNDWKDIYLVIFSQNKKDSSQFYFSLPVYEYYKEATHNDWKKITCYEEVAVYLSPKDNVLVYLWNQKKKRFSIRNMKIKIDQYTTN